jgi:hypothetical protein
MVSGRVGDGQQGFPDFPGPVGHPGWHGRLRRAECLADDANPGGQRLPQRLPFALDDALAELFGGVVRFLRRMWTVMARVAIVAGILPASPVSAAGENTGNR